MSKFTLTVPNEKAVFRFSFRNTGQPWPENQIMNGGAGDQDKTFSSPVCDELRITATFDTAEILDRVHFSNLSVTSGLRFMVTHGGSSQATTQTEEPRPKFSQNQTIRTEPKKSSEVEIVITGINQNTLTFDQVIFGKIDWSPKVSFSDASPYRNATRYSRQRIRSSSNQRLEDNARILPLLFFNITEDEYLDLEHLIDHVSNDGYCLVELDSSKISEHDAFLGLCSLSGFTSLEPNVKQCTLQVIEKNTQ